MSRRKQSQARSAARIGTLAGLSALALLPLAAAASWETHVGLNPHREELRGVVDVQYCTGGGKASVGAQRVPAGTPGFDNIVVQRQGVLTPLSPWSYSYDSGRSERGGGIVEYTDGSGFAIVASRDALTSPLYNDLTISKIDCNGNMSWHRGYGPTTGVVTAWDIIRANTGNGVTTFPGDLIALGEYTANGLTFVRVVRANPNTGVPSWTRDYSAPGGLSLFGRGIAEVDTPSVTDNLVVAGGVGNNAAIFQIDGDTGAFICGSQLPGLGVSRFNDITRHGGNGIAPGFTPVGETRTAATALPQAFVASYRSTGCALQQQVHWGFGNESETAQAVTLTRANTFNTVPAGQLLIVGNVVGPYSTNPASNDAWAHLMVPISLTPYTAGGFTGRRYGATGLGLAGTETAFDVAESVNGAYLVGATTSNWDGAADPLDGYSLRMSPVDMGTACAVPWKAPVVTLTPSSALTVGGITNPWREYPPLPRSPLPIGLCCQIATP